MLKGGGDKSSVSKSNLKVTGAKPLSCNKVVLKMPLIVLLCLEVVLNKKIEQS